MTLPDVQAIRRANLLLLLKECGDGRGSAAKLSRLTNVPAPYISQLKKPTKHSAKGRFRTMGDDTARALEKGMGKPSGWMDHDHSGSMDDRALRLAAKIGRLTPEQRQILEQTADAFVSTNGVPPPEDGPEIRRPKPRRH
jgi:hypothetical protein